MIAYRHSTYWVLAPSPTASELVVPAPLIYRVTYLTDAEAAQAEPWNVVGSMTDPFSYIGIRIFSPDGLPAQSLVLFKFGAKGPISYVADGRSFHGIEATTYQAASPLHRMIWDTEIHQGRLGYFLIGSERSMGLWKVVRAEVDYINRSIITIVPVKLANGLPSCHFDRIASNEIQIEIEHHWDDLQNALDRHSHRALITAPKNIVEGLLYYAIGDRIGGKRADLEAMLPTLRDLLLKKETLPLPFTELDYHLMSKLRLLHQRAHVEKGISRPLVPELALTAPQDLAEILRSVKLAD